jgi:uncharacterized delta-60 repeat protein
MKTLGRSWGAAIACFLVGLVWAAGMARGDSMAIQPDGGIVVTGQTFPEFGALARLNPDGSVDRGFGNGGYVIDTRLPAFVSVSLQSGGRVIAGAAGGPWLGRYLPSGSPDLAFGTAGIAGDDEPEQPHFRLGDNGPVALLVQPDGGIVAGGTRSLPGGASEGGVEGFDADGNLVGTVGRLPLPGGPASSIDLSDLVEEPDRSLIGVGSYYAAQPSYEREPLMARFVPGSGSDFDPSFGGGAGLVRLDLPPPKRFSSIFSAVTRQGEGLLAAGRTEGTFLLARFDRDGNLDADFGEGGYAAPPIVGPGGGPDGQASPEAQSWANDVGIAADGDVVVAGETTQWSNWRFSKSIGFYCEDCPQPMLARFDADGDLDPSFGDGGLLRLLRPGGGAFVRAEVDQVSVLGDGKLLLAGTVDGELHRRRLTTFVARLNPDGSYDSSFGSGGLAVLDFPCAGGSKAEKRKLGCVPHLRSKLRLFGMRRGRPAIQWRAEPSENWAGIAEVSLTLPRGLHLKKSFRSKLRVVPAGNTEATGMNVEVIRPNKKHKGETLLVQGLGAATDVKVQLPRGTLRVSGRLRQLRPHRKVSFRLRAEFTHLGWGGYGGGDEVIRRAG